MARFVICPVIINKNKRTAFLVQDIDLPLKPRFAQRVELIDALDKTRYQLTTLVNHVVPNYMKNTFLGTEHEETVRANFAELRAKYPKCDAQSSFNQPEIK